ncbi:MAG TPA: DedA family protein [Acidimicrobiales bacterium]|nr:DedA family protein [Acidimicrobiales bacterium]
MEHFLLSAGYGALVLLAFVEACCIPIPSEITFGYAGVLVAEHHLELGLVIVLGTLAELAGSYVAYTIGRQGGRPLVERAGRFALVTAKDLDRAERWLSGRGEFAVALGRALPVVRAFVSLVAGIARMPRLRFLVFSLIGTLVYVTVLTVIGDAVGKTWHRVAHGFSLAGYVVVALVVVAIAVYVRHRLREVRRERLAEAKGA